MTVVDDGGGDIDDPPAGQPQPPGEVGVLVVHEERGVEAADGLDGERAQDGRATGEAEDLDRLGKAIVVDLTEAPVGAISGVEEDDTGIVDARGG